MDNYLCKFSHWHLNHRSTWVTHPNSTWKTPLCWPLCTQTAVITIYKNNGRPVPGNLRGKCQKQQKDFSRGMDHSRPCDNLSCTALNMVRKECKPVFEILTLPAEKPLRFRPMLMPRFEDQDKTQGKRSISVTMAAEAQYCPLFLLYHITISMILWTLFLFASIYFCDY